MDGVDASVWIAGVAGMVGGDVASNSGERAHRALDSIGCSAAVVNATCEELLDWMEAGVGRGELAFPESNDPVRWSNGDTRRGIATELESIQRAA